MPCGGLALFPLDLPGDRLADLQGLLDRSELERAMRFIAPLHRDRFVAAHGTKRLLLGGLLHVDPGLLQFRQGAFGKPRLSGSAAGSDLQFNLSHSADSGLLGWAWGREVGVDIELWRKIADAEALVRRFFSPVEIASYMALSGSEREQGFFECWTRKEAYIKAVGRGLGLPLDSFDVSFGPGRSAALVTGTPDGSGAVWSLADLQVGAGASAAVVLEADVCHVRASIC